MLDGSLIEARLLEATSLARHPLGRSVARALRRALEAVDPEALVRRAVAWESGGLRLGDEVHRLPEDGRIFVAGAGKAGLAMARALVQTLGDRIVDGLVVIKAGHEEAPDAIGPMRVMVGGHPVPDRRSLDAGRALLAVARAAGPRDIVVCPISGGASSLVTDPVADITLEDLRRVTDGMLLRGADIVAMNAVRKHLDAIKGGGLALAAAPASVVGLILSDVVDDPLDVIASGPTVGDRSTFADALAAVRRALEPAEIPTSIAQVLEEGRTGARPETPAPDDPRLAGVSNVVLAGNDTATRAAVQALEAEGLDVVGRHALLGEAAAAGRALAQRSHELAGTGSIVAGGETTVTIRGDGVGGRNLEVALAAVESLERVPGALLVTFATDGDDGPSAAAGAAVTSETFARARARGLDPRTYLARNDSLAFFDALGDTIRTGPTGTNVCDLAILSWTPTHPPLARSSS
jgi:glycerate 2-kinase